MSSRKARIPKYSHHASDDTAVVYVNRKAVYLGKYNSPESRRRYGEVIAQLMAGGLPAKPKPVDNRETPKSIGELCLLFCQQKLPGYAPAEQACHKGAIKILCELFAETAAQDFGPLKLRAVRKAMVDGDPQAIGPDGKPKPRRRWSRDFVNKQIKRLRHVFRWGVSWEYVPSTVADSLSTVESLAAGATEAAESRTRTAIAPEKLQAVRLELSERSRDIFDLLLLTGARPGELIGLTTGMLDRSGIVWRADLSKHKTRHHGKSRSLFFNSSAQAILMKYVKADPDARLFNVERATFGTAVKSACERAFGMPDELRKPKKGLPPAELADIRKRAKAWRVAHTFTPHWCRHTVATTLADDVGIESAQRLLGHTQAAMTEHYAKAADRVAISAVQRLGMG